MVSTIAVRERDVLFFTGVSLCKCQFLYFGVLVQNVCLPTHAFFFIIINSSSLYGVDHCSEGAGCVVLYWCFVVQVSILVLRCASAKCLFADTCLLFHYN